eukprot:m.318131 g.318131  ORF g.318131 m.318131 type:complete len:129 (-) comp27568_c0_seq2:1514-1900(-)
MQALSNTSGRVRQALTPVKDPNLVEQTPKKSHEEKTSMLLYSTSHGPPAYGTFGSSSPYTNFETKLAALPSVRSSSSNKVGMNSRPVDPDPALQPPADGKRFSTVWQNVRNAQSRFTATVLNFNLTSA